MMLLTAGDEGYDAARTAWNLAVDQRPAAIAVAASGADVAAAVRTAAERGWRVQLQNTGHAATGRNDLAEVLLARTGGMGAVTVDPATRTARVEAGATWQALAEAAAPHGLAGLAGSSGGVGVVGYTLGGGLGWLARAHGLACHGVVAADVVLADGTPARVDADHEPDLHWALRGGGGSLAAVTALELSLVPLGEVYGGSLFFPVERAAEVLGAWREWTGSVPESVTSTGRVVHVPPLPTAPEHLRGRSFGLVQAVCLTGADDGADLLAPLRALGPEIDTVDMMPPTALGLIHMDPPAPVPADLEGWLLASADDDAMRTLVEHAPPGGPFVAMNVRHLGGAVARPAVGGGAVDAVTEPFAVYAVGIAPTPEVAGAVRGRLSAVGDALASWRSERGYGNLAERPASTASLFTPDAYARLQEVKRRYDPDGRFVAAHTVSG